MTRRAAAAVLAASMLGACQPDAPAALDDAAGWTHHHPAATSGAGGARGDAAHNQLLASVRSATARYQRIEVALADGYELASGCVESPFGGMGYHYARMDRFDGAVVPEEPELLLYEPQKNGRLRLVAVEYLVPAAAWDPVHGPDSPPMLGSQVFDDHRAPGSGGPPFPHYQLHAWIWANNPAGLHTQFNPTISCRYAN